MTSPTINRPNTARDERSILQRREESALARHPYQVELTGGLRSLAWPSICANCGAPASGRLTVRKVFIRPRMRGRHRHGMIKHTIPAAQIPYCAPCVQRHRELTPPTNVVQQALGVLFTPLLIPIVGSAIFGVITLRVVLDMSPTDPYARYAWGLPALFLFICMWSLFAAWHATQPARVEPPSEVTRACDFSDDVSRLFERERRIYAMRNKEFADALRHANHDRVWTAADDHRSGRRSLAVLAVGGAVAAAVWVWVVFGPQ